MTPLGRSEPETAVASAAPRTIVRPPDRRESPILPAELSDEDVVGRWLAAKAIGGGRLATATLAQYRTEAERMLWYARQVNTPISA
ncbi:hypothetical protein AYM40_36925 (plasmid) [Paraburkholderia phytofirmans OLGA172]|uniref:Uncharacterized protein n=1 Tax=Paraburkholderia phytofirmans OLGA172 TaxID=1417228 RepID=A0A160FXH2_9BURK|nr:hypothetical protein [Paraburkholderia phytofirmans]ANB77926.1 hypothetical protein AYM40_36925 [Paraburkholderia phytofirmans OLGA172]